MIEIALIAFFLASCAGFSWAGIKLWEGIEPAIKHLEECEDYDA